MSKEYIELQIDGDPTLFDELTALLIQIGFEGFWEEADSLKCYANSDRWNDGVRQNVEQLVGRVAQAHGALLPKIQTNRLVDKNWNEEWEKTIRPIRVTDRIVIAPTWETYQPAAGEIVLTIDPKMSFGTGYHETTRLTLTLLEKHCTTGMTVLDIGTGTGVLAIAATKLGAQSVIGIDNDEWAFSNALENVALNGVDAQVRILSGDLSVVPNQHFDMIVANIQRNVLLEMLSGIQKHLTIAGFLILSGLLYQDKDPMLQATHKHSLEVIEELREGDWIALACRNVAR